MTDLPRPVTIKTNAGKPSSVTPINNSPLSTNAPSQLTSQFAEIIRRYKYYCQHIQRLLKETDKSYTEINETRVLTPGMKNIFY